MLNKKLFSSLLLINISYFYNIRKNQPIFAGELIIIKQINIKDMPRVRAIPAGLKERIKKLVDDFNKKELREYNGKVYYKPEFRGKYLYLDRVDFNEQFPVMRLGYTGNLRDWDFAIYRFSKGNYAKDDLFIVPGFEYFDGTIKGALRCGMEAYPPG